MFFFFIFVNVDQQQQYSRMEKAKQKFIAYVALKEKWGDCNLERVAPFLATQAQLLPPFATDNDGRQLMFVVAENLDRDIDVDHMRALAADYLFSLFLQQPQFQQHGNALVLDLGGASFMTNRAAQHDMNELMQATPCRLGQGSIVHPPWWFSLVFRVVASILPAKIVGRIAVRSEQQLAELIPKAHLLKRLGGDLEFDGRAWLKHRFDVERKPLPAWLANDAAPPKPTQ
jgi:hypothetical protein